LVADDESTEKVQLGLRLFALITLAASAALLCLLPLLLEYFGSGWKSIPTMRKPEVVS
jgi:hypothetical protein